MATAHDVSPTQCRPKGAGFVLDVLALDASGHPAGRVAVPPGELLDWAMLAAQYDGRFRAALELRLASLPQPTDGGQHAVRQG
jgi:hypothetical protein